MSGGADQSTKPERDNYNKHRRTEHWEIKNYPDEEKRELRDVCQQKGFAEELLKQVPEVIIKDKERWVEGMMKNMLGMIESISLLSPLVSLRLFPL